MQADTAEAATNRLPRNRRSLPAVKHSEIGLTLENGRSPDDQKVGNQIGGCRNAALRRDLRNNPTDLFRVRYLLSQRNIHPGSYRIGDNKRECPIWIRRNRKMSERTMQATQIFLTLA